MSYTCNPFTSVASIQWLCVCVCAYYILGSLVMSIIMGSIVGDL